MGNSYWDKISAVGAFLASVLIPAAVAFAGHYYSNAASESQNRLKYIEIAASVVRDEPKPENAALRAWAVDLLTHYSKEVPLSPAAQQALKDHAQPVYAGGWGTTTVDTASWNTVTPRSSSAAGK